jgi:5-formyltetrahydrofolate cyclo-ligase
MALEASDPKAGLRRRLRRRRAALAREMADAGERAAAQFPEALVRSVRVAAGYHPIGSEMDPQPLLRRLRLGGVGIVLPAGVATDAPLVFREYRPSDLVTPDVFGIASPALGAAEPIPDLVIAPVLAFDRRGGRLGQGAGAYDRTLRHLRAHGRLFVVGLAFAGQELPACPVSDHDERLDAILTERGYIGIEEDP